MDSEVAVIDDDNDTDHAIFGHNLIPFDITFKSRIYGQLLRLQVLEKH